MSSFWAVFFGGGLGACLRFGLMQWAARNTWLAGLPWMTLFINVIGSFLMGVMVGGIEHRWNLSPIERSFLLTGVLGGFTTFSTYSLDALLLMERGAWTAALGYTVLSVVLAISACASGYLALR